MIRITGIFKKYLFSEARVKREGQSLSAEQRPEDSATLFLIDFEAVEDGNRLQLKPRSRKFAVSTLFESHMAQNWFFRRADTG
jgi:hypothetical protein